MVSQKEYKKITDRNSPKSNLFVDCIWAFIIGGGICTLGQALINFYSFLGLGEQSSKTLCSVSLIFIGIFFTAVHLYDNLAKHAGAGTLVPITGFANSIASPAIEFKTEGLVTGLGAKMFVIAGPVIVYGTTASVIYGLIHWIIRLF